MTLVREASAGDAVGVVEAWSLETEDHDVVWPLCLVSQQMAGDPALVRPTYGELRGDRAVRPPPAGRAMRSHWLPVWQKLKGKQAPKAPASP